jgi:hypothetical protein
MRAFAVAYPEFVQAALAQIPKPENEKGFKMNWQCLKTNSTLKKGVY